MFKAVLFDLDNTLMDFMSMKKISCEAAISAMIDAGLDLEHDKAYDKLFELYGKYGIEHQKIFQEFLSAVNGEIDYKILSSGVTAYRRVQAGFMRPYPHVRATLIALRERGIKLGILSDAPKMRAWLRLSEMSLTDFFDTVITLDDTGEMKPSPKAFSAAVKGLGVEAGRILFVGDNPERDIKGAKAAGMKTALAKYGQIFPDGHVKADYELKGVRDLLGIVGKK